MVHTIKLNIIVLAYILIKLSPCDNHLLHANENLLFDHVSETAPPCQPLSISETLQHNTTQ